MINIAIDGPSGAGKSTVARALAKDLSFVYVDTGAMYRAIGLYVRDHSIDPADAQKVTACLSQIRISLSYGEDGAQHVHLNEKDVSREIRENEISRYASAVSKIPAVREFLLSLQRDMAKTHHVVMDGRDIGTVILPDAQLKIFLFASPEARAQRRAAELAQKGEVVSVEQLLAEMQARDEQDRTRDVAPAVPAADAVMMDNSHMSIEENTEAIKALIKERNLL